jgi:hypothetical protein
MPKLLLLLGLIVAVWYWWSYQKRLPQEQRRGFLWKSGFWAVLGISILLVYTGRMHWLGAGLAALVPLVKGLIALSFRALPLMRILRRFKTTPSQFRTRSLVVTINFSSGQMDGEILVGEHAGKQLSQLSKEQLKAFAEELKGSDRESSVLLQAYLLRSGTQGFQGTEDFTPSGFADLSKDEAYSVLGLEPGASEQDIIKAHKRLMQRMHPDRGGSDYLAAKINSAKDKLI